MFRIVRFINRSQCCSISIDCDQTALTTCVRVDLREIRKERNVIQEEKERLQKEFEQALAAKNERARQLAWINEWKEKYKKFADEKERFVHKRVIE